MNRKQKIVQSRCASNIKYRARLFKRWIALNHCPADSVIGFPNTYPLDSDLSGG